MKTSIRTAFAVLAASALGGIGCGGTYYATVSSHTVETGGGGETDVVWLEDTDGRVYRCQPTQQGPVCQRPQGLR